MNKNIIDLIPKKYFGYKVSKIKREGSKRNYYRIKKDHKSFIFMDSSKEVDQFRNFLKVHEILSKIAISIPKIYYTDEKNKILIIEDFGNLRFDTILKLHNIKDLLLPAIDSLICIKKKINYDSNYTLPIYNYKIFKKEISEFVDFYYPFYMKKKIPLDLINEFYSIWKNHYNSLEFNFKNFIHKDFNLNNLIYLPEKNKQYKCGIIDFQDSFWGEDCWDLFSLLEDSRIFFSDKYNDELIEYYLKKTFQKKTIESFYNKYHFFNSSRQVRLLGRWVKLNKNYNNKFYLNFIDITNNRLKKSLSNPNMYHLKLLFNKLMPDIYAI